MFGAEQPELGSENFPKFRLSLGVLALCRHRPSELRTRYKRVVMILADRADSCLQHPAEFGFRLCAATLLAHHSGDLVPGSEGVLMILIQCSQSDCQDIAVFSFGLSIVAAERNYGSNVVLRT